MYFYHPKYSVAQALGYIKWKRAIQLHVSLGKKIEY
jgi:hypothetical protein